MKRDGDFGPTMVRLAWHSSGTYDKMTKTGGSGGGTIRFKEELAHGANAGLDKAVKRLEPVKAKHPEVSWADLIAFVGVVAIEQMGGPAIPFSYGRVDEMNPAAATPDGKDHQPRRSLAGAGESTEPPSDESPTPSIPYTPYTIYPPPLPIPLLRHSNPDSPTLTTSPN